MNENEYHLSLLTSASSIISSPGISTPKQKKPGPRPNKCIWCYEVQCSHCQCQGYPKCDHRQGEPCTRQRYKRRLVCNPCEKNKLKDDGSKKIPSRSVSKDRLFSWKNSKDVGRTVVKSNSVDSGLTSNLSSNQQCSFEALLRVASNEMRKVNSVRSTGITPSEHVVTPPSGSCDDIGLCMDGVINSPTINTDLELSYSLDGAGEVVSVNSMRNTPTNKGMSQCFFGPQYSQQQYMAMQFYPNQPVYQQVPVSSGFQQYPNYGHPENLPSPMRGTPHLINTVPSLVQIKPQTVTNQDAVNQHFFSTDFNNENVINEQMNSATVVAHVSERSQYMFPLPGM